MRHSKRTALARLRESKPKTEPTIKRYVAKLIEPNVFVPDDIGAIDWDTAQISEPVTIARNERGEFVFVPAHVVDHACKWCRSVPCMCVTDYERFLYGDG